MDEKMGLIGFVFRRVMAGAFSLNPLCARVYGGRRVGEIGFVLRKTGFRSGESGVRSEERI